ncbi:MAG: CocE/NonD family hydrolase [Pseudomonadota bacterium]
MAETEHLWIEMPDGVRLAARLWLPEGAGPVPAILEYIPYRKADMVRPRDERNHPFFAAHGYACIRVDMRGSGDSEGHMPDMYCQHELDDARHVIDWLAEQPWCNGRVGMFGTSWGGTASLQASVDAPEALKAIIAVCATHDRYTDDIHHMGGCVLTDSIEWGATLSAILAAPPTPNVGSNWKEIWRKRLDHLEFPLERWLREEGCNAYWRHGSVVHSAERLSVPILAVGGWSDRYSNSVMALADARPDLVWGIVGPWGHHYPDHGHPGPGIGFQSLALEWWDCWLATSSPKKPEWPRLRLWLRDYEPPQDILDARVGAWIEIEPRSQHRRLHTLHLTNSGLASEQADITSVIPLDLAVGRASGDTGYFGRFGGLPVDQDQDDARSLTFETLPLSEDLTIIGVVQADLRVACTPPTGQVAIRLCDVAEDGTSARISYSVRNMLLDDTLEPDRPEGACDISVPLHSVAYRVPAGHRLRLALSASLWPLVWPSKDASSVRLLKGSLTISELMGPPQPLRVPLPQPVDLPVVKSHNVRAAPKIRRFSNEDGGSLVSGWHQPEVAVEFPESGTVFAYETRAEHRVDPSDAGTASALVDHRMTIARTDGTATVHSRVSVHTEGASFVLEGGLDVDWNDTPVCRKTWSKRLPR